MNGRRENIRSSSQSRPSRISIAIAIGISFGCLFAFIFPRGTLSPSSLNSPRLRYRRSATSNLIVPTKCDSSVRLSALKVKAQLVIASERNAELKRQVKELTAKLQLAEQLKDIAQKQIVLSEQHRAGPFGTVKSLRTNPTVAPDESVNPRLAKTLQKIAVQRELIVALANSNMKEMLEVWFTSIKRVGIPNYLVVALDSEISSFCQSKDVPVYDIELDKDIDSIARTGGAHDITRLKFQILTEFLQLGYGILVSDVAVVYLQNPFDHLYRDSDVEALSDGHSNRTAYGFNDVFDDPAMGWARYAHSMRVWVYNSGFFYIRPTIPAIELLVHVADRGFREKTWDQEIFNEELFFPSNPYHTGLHASRRSMDFYLFMNSKVLFKFVRKDASLIRRVKPVIVYVNYHPDKLPRMKAIVEFHVNGKQDALKPFPDGSDW